MTSMIKTKNFELATYEKGDKDSEKLAIVLPGKLDTKDYSHIASHVNLLAELGFYAVSFDPPGTWESPGELSLYTTTNYIKAVEEVIENFGNKPTFVTGHSRGASVAMISGVKNPYVIGYASIMPGITENSLTALTKKVSYRDLPPGGGEKIKEFDLPDSFYEDEENYRVTEEIKMSKKPKLIIAGKDDTICLPERVKETFDRLSDPKVFSLIDSPHDYRKYPEKIEEVNRQLKNFINKYLI